jgi:beta-glucanase (GH16 family)
MKKTKLSLTLLILLLWQSAFAQNWQLVWADEFNGSISNDWVFETGAGGWGNNELQYYRRENASVQNGNLVITAKRENFGGAGYTSVRMKTQGKKSWKYGKMEARIAMPSFQGVWPAFWMLGDNISSVGWPACGEIDVMEHVNTGGEVFGTIHWTNAANQYSNYGGSTSTNITAFHLYTVEWDASMIRWFVDGIKYHEVSILNGVNGTSEFHNNFFLLLNMAIGGNWPGFSIDNNAFPANMLVDYVRVYQNTGTPNPIGVTTLAGTYFLQNRHSGLYMDVAGVSSTDGANIQQWSYSGNTNQQFELTHLGGGSYRILAKNSGKSLDVADISVANGANVVQWPYWAGNNQQFIALDAGGGFYKLMAKNSGKLIEVAGFSTINGGNVQQWEDAGQASAQWKLVPVTPPFSRRIEAESFSAMAGIQTEACTEGGLNAGYIDNGDWMSYSAINIPSSGSYRLDYRVASVSGGKLSQDINAGTTVLGAVTIPATGGWQNWTTVSQTVYLNAGTYNFGIFAATGGWNLNWWNITRVSDARTIEDADQQLEESSAIEFAVTPNPAMDHIRLESTMNLEGGSVKIVDQLGNVRLEMEAQSTISISSLHAGIYTLMFSNEGYQKTIRFIKQ